MNLPEPVRLLLTITTLLFSALTLFFLLRAAINGAVLFFVERTWLPGYLKNSREGWERESDKAAMERVIAFARTRMRHRFLFRCSLRDDLREVLRLVSTSYGKTKDPDRLVLSFSLRRLLECLLLAADDLYREYSAQPWFRLIRNTKISRFLRVHTPLPPFGANLLYEGFFRFFYGTLLLKAGYYAMYLYGRKNGGIMIKRKGIPDAVLDERAEQIEKLLDPAGWEPKSPVFDEAAAVYNDLLTGFGLLEDDLFLAHLQVRRRRSKRRIRRLIAMTEKALIEAFLPEGKTTDDREQLLYACRVLGRLYHPKAEEPPYGFRLKECLEMGYMASLLLFRKLNASPAASLVLNSVTVEFILTVRTISELRIVRTVSRLGGFLRYVSTYRKFSGILRAVRGYASPLSLLWSIGVPIATRQVLDSLRQYVYTRAGRILLYGCEAHMLRKKSLLGPLVTEHRVPADAVY